MGEKLPSMCGAGFLPSLVLEVKIGNDQVYQNMRLGKKFLQSHEKIQFFNDASKALNFARPQSNQKYSSIKKTPEVSYITVNLQESFKLFSLFYFVF